MLLSSRFEQALQYAFRLHSKQRRKGIETPYVAHLLAVTALVLEDGGDEDQAIAALLHDGPEDQGGRETLEEIRSQFGERVARIVEACTDTFETPKPDWRPRKEAYLAHLAEVPADVLRVSLADKHHNAQTILRDLHSQGDAIWTRFTGGKEGSLWYYRELARFFVAHFPSPLAGELVGIVRQIEELSARGASER